MVGHKVKIQSQQTPFLSGASSWGYDLFCENFMKRGMWSILGSIGPTKIWAGTVHFVLLFVVLLQYLCQKNIPISLLSYSLTPTPCFNLIWCVNNSSCECNKVVSAFWSFCRRCGFVFKFLLFFIVFRCLISFIKIKLLWLQTWSKFLIVCFYLKFPNQQKTQFCPNVRYDLVAFTWRLLSTCLHFVTSSKQ